MKRLLALAFGAGLVAVLVTSLGASQAQPDHSKFMQAKLEHAQKILAGLTTNNLELVATNAEQLSDLSEQAPWQIIKTEEYFQHSLEFRRAADALARAGDEENLDAAALAYVDVTLKCISCHKYVRDVRVASVAAPDLSFVAQNP